ncbi:hypothetical protein DRN97_05010 [Methanosarcinales archaeon]|nr:MAG: hypothetical protein DRN97_05010 [Methanosarcinales archaeon]
MSNLDIHTAKKGGEPVFVVAIFIFFALIFWFVGAASASNIYASQIGYGINDSKIAVVVSPDKQTFSIVNVNTNSTEYSGVLEEWGTSWSGSGEMDVCYIADFTDFNISGRYKLVIGESESYPFSISSDSMIYGLYEEAMFFFKVQRCGVEVPGWHGVCHADDAALNGQVDVSGGWHDAGDYNKYMGNTPYAAYILLRAYESEPDLWHDLDGNGLPDILDEVKVALDWMMKMQTPDGSVYERVYSGYDYWGSPEFETDNIPGTGDERQLDTDEDCYIAAKHAFAMALASSIYHDFEPAYAQTCKNSAIKAYEWAVNNPSKNPVNYYGGGMYPGHECAIALAALELYNITGENRYMKNAEAILRNGLNHSGTPSGTESPSTWDKQWSLAEFRYLEWGADEELKQEIFVDLEKLIGDHLQRARTNPYGISTYTLNWGVGIDGYLCGMAIDSLLMYKQTLDPSYLYFAKDQIQWIYGLNPFNLCFITGEGSKFPLNVHHRLDRVIPGAMVLGAYGNPPQYADDKNRWQYNEYAIDIQAQFVFATALLSGLEFTMEYEPPKGHIISPGEGEVEVEEKGVCHVEVLAQADDSGQSNIRVRVYNSGAEPLEGVSIRYFLNLSELPHGPNGMGLEGPWCKEGVLKGPVQYHDDVYYLEFSLNEPVEPKTFVEDTWMMFDRDNWNDWDSSNDWSAEWNQTGQWYLDQHIPVYQKGNLIWGYEPPGAVATATPLENISSSTPVAGEKPFSPSFGFFMLMVCIAIVVLTLVIMGKRKRHGKS